MRSEKGIKQLQGAAAAAALLEMRGIAHILENTNKDKVLQKVQCLKVFRSYICIHQVDLAQSAKDNTGGAHPDVL